MKHLERLVQRELWKIDGKQPLLLSLRPTSEFVPSVGTAWFSVIDYGNNGKLSAVKGTYRLSVDAKDQNTLLLNLSFTRRYTKTFSAKEKNPWLMDTDYARNPTGVTVEIPLTDGAVPEDTVTLVVSKAYFVTEAGEPTTKTTGGLFGKARQVFETGHLAVGDTYEFCGYKETQDYQIARIVLEQFGPPGYKERASYTKKAELELNKRVFALLDESKHAQETGDLDLAIRKATEAIKLHPYSLPYQERAEIHLKMRKYPAAIADATEAIRRGDDREYVAVSRYLIRAHAFQGDRNYGRAIADLNRATQLVHDFPEYKTESFWWDVLATNALILASSPDPSLRNGKKAFDLASEACRSSKMEDARSLDALAAAYANLSDFPKAIEFEQKAVEKSADDASRAEFESRLQIYRQGRPYRMK